MIKVLIFGTFDLLHPGHKYFLQQAKKVGNSLIVIVARDKNVLKLKKRKPIQDEKTRLANIKKTKIANRVLLGNKDWSKRYQVISKIKPDIIALGYDQPFDKLRAIEQRIKIIRIKAFKKNIYKTSLLSKHLAKKNKSSTARRRSASLI